MFCRCHWLDFTAVTTREYIINTIKSGLVIIHQNRAHERVLYEQFLQDMTLNEAVSQQLLFPIHIFNKYHLFLLKS